MTADSHQLGFYGKIPIKGDFLSRHLPRTFIDPWDQWLQESMVTSRTQLKDQWLDNYLTSPIWRFAISKGVCDESAWIGLMLPSVDRVGRYFPLTLAAAIDSTYALLAIADQEQAWFEQIEQIALSALEQSYDFDTFYQAIKDCEIPEKLRGTTTPAVPDQSKPLFDTNNNWRMLRQESDSVSTNLRIVTEHYLRQNFPELSLWWTSGSEKVEPSILVCNKLPGTQQFSALLSANWQQWGWDNISTSGQHNASVDNPPLDELTNRLFNDATPLATEESQASP